jgi:HSP20 family protein
MLSLWNGFDDLFRFDDYFRLPSSREREGRFVPAVDVLERDGNYLIKAELPGMKASDVDIRVEGNVLTVSGERKYEHKEEKEGYQRFERRYGSFCRSFTLPENAKAEAIEADLSEGVLTLTIPKKEMAEPRKIEVRGASGRELPKVEHPRADVPRASA